MLSEKHELTKKNQGLNKKLRFLQSDNIQNSSSNNSISTTSNQSDKLPRYYYTRTRPPDSARGDVGTGSGTGSTGGNRAPFMITNPYAPTALSDTRRRSRDTPRRLQFTNASASGASSASALPAQLPLSPPPHPHHGESSDTTRAVNYVTNPPALADLVQQEIYGFVEK